MKRDSTREYTVSLEEYVNEIIKIENKKSRYEVIKEIFNSTNSGEIKLEDPNPPRTFEEFIVRLDYSLWFWIVQAFVAITVLLSLLDGELPLIVYARVVIGSVYVFFIPGYLLVESLYPDSSEVRNVDKLLLSIGLSLAIIPLIGLVLNFTPWGITTESILFSISIYTMSFSFLAIYRKYKIIIKKYIN